MQAEAVDMLYIAIRLLLLIAMKVCDIPVFDPKKQFKDIESQWNNIKAHYGVDDYDQDYLELLNRGEGYGVQG